MNLGIIPEQNCPYCNHTMNATSDTHAEPRQPELGDVSICGYCGELSWFGIDLRLIKMSEREQQKVIGELSPVIVEFMKNCKSRHKQLN